MVAPATLARYLIGDDHLKLIKVLFCAVAILALGLFPFTVSAQTHAKPTESERKELLTVRRLVWDSYFNNDQGQLKKLIAEDFLTINPGEEHWQDKTEFIAGAQGFAEHQGKLVSLIFPKTEIQEFGDVAVLYSIVRITMESGGKRESLNCRTTEVFQKREGQWVNTGAHVDSGR
jgi:ketosteroid isomerase-like protein